MFRKEVRVVSFFFSSSLPYRLLSYKSYPGQPKYNIMPPGIVTPKKGPKPARFKREIAPNSRAKCRGCGQKIQKNMTRAGIVASNQFGRSQEYYHMNCLSNEQRQKLPSAEQQERQEQIDEVVSQHPDLREALCDLRRRLKAKHHYDHAWNVLNNDTIDQLIIIQPITRVELGNVKGIGEKKLQKFGKDILDVIAKHVARNNPIEIVDSDDDDDDDDDVVTVL